jgi:hypothetical protein
MCVREDSAEEATHRFETVRVADDNFLQPDCQANTRDGTSVGKQLSHFCLSGRVEEARRRWQALGFKGVSALHSPRVVHHKTGESSIKTAASTLFSA